MDNGFEKSWRLILLTMIMVFSVSFLGIIPFFQKHTYFFMALGETAIFIPVFIGAKIYGIEKYLEKSIFSGFSPVLMLTLILIPICMQNFIIFVTLPLENFIYNIFGESESGIEPACTVAEFIVQIFSVCLIPALAEEFLCRGVIMRLLKPYGIVVMVMFSALAFAMLHFSMTSFIVIFMIGVLLAAVKMMTGSIWACVLVHFSNNLAALIQEQISMNNTEMIIFEIIAALLFPFLVLHLINSSKRKELTYQECKKIEFSPSMIFSGVFFSAVIVADLIIK